MSAQYNAGHSLFFLIHLCHPLAAFFASAGFKLRSVCLSSGLHLADFKFKVLLKGLSRLRPARWFFWQRLIVFFADRALLVYKLFNSAANSWLATSLCSAPAGDCLLRLCFPCTAGTCFSPSPFPTHGRNPTPTWLNVALRFLSLGSKGLSFNAGCTSILVQLGSSEVLCWFEPKCAEVCLGLLGLAWACLGLLGLA